MSSLTEEVSSAEHCRSAGWGRPTST